MNTFLSLIGSILVIFLLTKIVRAVWPKQRDVVADYNNNLPPMRDRLYGFGSKTKYFAVAGSIILFFALREVRDFNPSSMRGIINVFASGAGAGMVPVIFGLIGLAYQKARFEAFCILSVTLAVVQYLET